jgi:hypothetical protein
MSQSRQNHLFTCLFNLTRKEDLVKDRINLLSVSSNLVYISSSCLPTHLVEVKHQVQFTHVPEKRVQNLHEKVYSLQVRQFVVVCVNACAEEEAGVSAVYDLGHVAELDEVGLVLLVAWGYETVDLLRCLARSLVVFGTGVVGILRVWRLGDGGGRWGSVVDGIGRQ